MDFGREAYTAWRLSSGQVLYRDLSSLFGPLAAYVDAAAMSVFGPSLGVLFVLNAVLIGVTTILVYLFVSRVARRSTAFLAALMFLGVFAFADPGASNFNFLSPYSQAAVLGVFLAMAAVLFLERWLAQRSKGAPRIVWLFAAGVCIGLTLLTKPEIAVASVGSGAFALIAGGRNQQQVAPGESSGSGPLTGWGLILTAGAGFALPLVITFLAFGVSQSFAVAGKAVLATFRPLFSANPVGMEFYRQQAGLTEPAGRLLEIVVATVWIGGTLVAFGMLDRFIVRLGRRLRRFGRLAALLAGGATLVIAVGSLNTLVFATVPRSVPLLLLGALIWCGLLLVRGESVSGAEGAGTALERGLPSPVESVRRNSAKALVVWIILSLVLLAKLGLRPRFSHYGFYLAAPAGVALTVFLVEIAPQWIGRRTGTEGLVRLTGIGIVLLTVGFNSALTVREVRSKDVRIAEGADMLWARGEVAKAAKTTLNRIEDVTSPEATLTVIPEGASLNYWSRRVNPTPHVSFMPPELAFYGTDRMLHELRASSPDFVVLWARPLPDYGGGVYGDRVGTGSEIVAFVRQRYRCVERISVQGWSFDFELLERRDRRHAATSSNCG